MWGHLERLKKEEQAKKISEKPFKVTLNNYKEKFENPFNRDGRETVYPEFEKVEDPYEASKDEMFRTKWMSENRILFGDFKPSAGDKCLERINRTQLPDMVRYMKKVIMVDWAEVNFIIGTNPDDYIEIKFEKSSADTQLGLKAYMNTLLTT